VHLLPKKERSSVARFSRVLPLYLAEPVGANPQTVWRLDGRERIREQDQNPPDAAMPKSGLTGLVQFPESGDLF